MMLEETLTQLLDIQKRLNELAREKTEVIKQNDVEKLEELLKAEETTVQLLEKVEDKRQAVVSAFLKEHRIEDAEPTMSTLANYLPAEQKQRFEELHEALLEEIVELKERNELNDLLTKQSLYFINASLELVSPESEKMNYQNPKSKQTPPPSRQSFFDSKA